MCIKTDKATSLDCTTDYVIKLLCKHKQLSPSKHPREWEYRENLLRLVNECFISKDLPNEAKVTRLMLLSKDKSECPRDN